MRHTAQASSSASSPPAKPQVYDTLVEALARAWRWKKLLDQEAYVSLRVGLAARRQARD